MDASLTGLRGGATLLSSLPPCLSVCLPPSPLEAGGEREREGERGRGRGREGEGGRERARCWHSSETEATRAHHVLAAGYRLPVSGAQRWQRKQMRDHRDRLQGANACQHAGDRVAAAAGLHAGDRVAIHTRRRMSPGSTGAGARWRRSWQQVP